MNFRRAIAIPTRVICLALLGVSFYIAYRGQRLLETQEDLDRGWILFVIAAIPLYVAWFLGRKRETAPVPEEPFADPQAPAKTVSRLSSYIPDWAERAIRAIAPYWPVLLVVALAATLRFYKLDSLPFGVSFDEAQNGLEARRILNDPLDYHPIFIPGASQLPALFFYVFAVMMIPLGEGILALRTTTAISGILTVAGLYLLGRELFGHRVGLVAALLLAVMRWHLNFSRIAFHGIFGGLFMVFALYFLVRGFKGRGWWNYALSGVFIGIGLQSYYSFVFVPLIVVLFWLHYALSEGRRRLVPLTRGLLIVGLVSGLVVVPLARYALDHPDHVTQRAETVSITTNRSTEEVVETAVRSTKKHALMFNVEGDFNGRHNLPSLPMLDRFTGMFFALGTIFAIARVHQARHFLLLCWLVLLMQPGIWSLEGEAPQGYRTFMITPAIALLAALPLGLLADIALQVRGSATLPGSAGATTARAVRFLRDNLTRVVAGAALVFLLAQVIFRNYDTFFNEQLESPIVWSYFEPAETVVGKQLDRFGPQEVIVYSSATIANTPTSTFLATDSPAMNTIVLPRDVPFQVEKDVLVFFDGRDGRESGAFTWVQHLYPEAEFRQYHPPGAPEPVVVHQAFISAELIAASYGVDASYSPATGGSPVARQEKGLAADWRQQTPVPLPFSAEWSAALKVPETANKGLRIEAPGRIRLSLDDDSAAVQGEGIAEIVGDLPLGLHGLKVQVEATGRGEVRLLWLTPEGNWTAVPESALFLPPIASYGLTGSYYNLQNQASPLTPAAAPVQRQVDPYIAYRYHVPPVPGVAPFVVRWAGKLTVPEPGGYRLATDSRDELRLLVDGQPYLNGKGYLEGTLPVAPGVHEIELSYAAYSGSPYVLFYWLPPGQPRAIVPFDHLSPR